ncbi:MAG: hypothetical protein AAGA56_29605 [Myxococcota bacterium]
MKRLVPWLIPFLAMVGCGEDFEATCEELAEACDDDPDYNLRPEECKRDGRALERAAVEAGCEDLFDAHAGCVSEAACAWDTECVTSRRALDTCIADFATE